MTRLSKLRIVAAVQCAFFALSVAYAVGQQDCNPPLAQGGMGITRLGPHKNAKLFVAGDFKPLRQTNRDNKVGISDLAFVSTTSTSAGEQKVLSVMISSDFGCFTQPLPSNVLAGEDPVLIAVGRFNDDELDDIAIVDAHADQFNAPKLRIFLRGAKEGEFTSKVVALQRGERPVGLAVGHLREPKSPNAPLDVAIVSAARDFAAAAALKGRGVLRILFNNGKGEFDESIPSPPPMVFGDFQPAAMVASDNLRDGATTVDLVIKEATVPRSKRRILYLKNDGNGRFPDVAALAGAGDVPELRLAKFRPDPVGDRFDIITFDRDMTIRIFKNMGLGVFGAPSKNLQTILEWNSRSEFEFLEGAEPQFLVVDFKDRQLRLKALAKHHEKGQGVLSLAFDNGVIDKVDFQEVRPIKIATPETDLDERKHNRVATAHQRPSVLVPIVGIVDRFNSTSSGAKGPVFALAARHIVTEATNSPCPVSFIAVKSAPTLGKGDLLAAKKKGGTRPAKRCVNERPKCMDNQDPIPAICAGSFADPCQCVCPKIVDDPEPVKPSLTNACETMTGFPVLIVFDD